MVHFIIFSLINDYRCIYIRRIGSCLQKPIFELYNPNKKLKNRELRIHAYRIPYRYLDGALRCAYYAVLNCLSILSQLDVNISVVLLQFKIRLMK